MLTSKTDFQRILLKQTFLSKTEPTIINPCRSKKIVPANNKAAFIIPKNTETNDK